MPRNGSGVMSKPPNTTAQPNTTIRSAMFNSVIDDLIQDANNARPITAGGTGAQTIEAMRAAFEIDRKTVFATKSADYTLVKDDNNAAISVSATATMALAAASTLGMSWHALIIADGGTATIDPTGSEKINGQANLVLQDKQWALVISTGLSGDEFTAIVSQGNVFTDPITFQGSIDLSGNTLKNAGSGAADYLKGLITAKTSAFVVSVAAGEIKGNGKLVINAAPFTKNLSATWVAGSGNGGRLEVAALTANTTYHLHALVKNSDGSFDWGFSTSATAPTIPAGYTWVGRFDWCYINAGVTSVVDYTQVGNLKYLAATLWFTTSTLLADDIYTLPATAPVPAGIRTSVTANFTGAAGAAGSFDFYANDADASTAVGGPAVIFARNDARVAAGAKLRTNLLRQLRLYSTFSGSGNTISGSVFAVEDFSLNRVY